MKHPKSGSPIEHLEKWKAINDIRVRSHSAEYIGAILSQKLLDDLIASGAVEDPGTREFLVSGYSKAMATTNPVGALEVYLQHFSPTSYGIHAVIKEVPPNTDFPQLLRLLPQAKPEETLPARSRVLAEWAEADPEAAATFIAGNLTFDYLKGPLQKWSSIEEGEPAGKWVESLPEGKTRDKSAQLLSLRIADSDPARGWLMAMNMGHDLQLKTETLQRIYDRWHAKDPAAADKALDLLESGSGLSKQ